jgi:hypothetical protein
MLEESEATSSTEKPTKGNVLSRVPSMANPNLTSSSAQPQAQVSEDKPAAATEDEDNVDDPVTSEDEESLDSSSGDASE